MIQNYGRIGPPAAIAIGASKARHFHFWLLFADVAPNACTGRTINSP
jgi:hypothetical protein